MDRLPYHRATVDVCSYISRSVTTRLHDADYLANPDTEPEDRTIRGSCFVPGSLEKKVRGLGEPDRDDPDVELSKLESDEELLYKIYGDKA